jgi:hypothetical protein
MQIPAKVYEMLLFGKPILALDDDGAAGEFVKRFGLGGVVSATDVDSIARSIEGLLKACPGDAIRGRNEALRIFDAVPQTRCLASVLTETVNRCGHNRRRA